MNRPGAPDPEYVAARKALLDGLGALGPQRDAVIVVGAQAIYMHTGRGELAVAELTTDGDIGLDPAALDDAPLIGELMKKAHFKPDLQQPGIWWSKDGVEVDLLVPESLGGPGRRGARLGTHGKHVARKARGLEAAMVDNERREIAALDPDDDRTFDARVAGIAALLVAKAHKLHDRLEDSDQPIEPKDALDALRLLQTAETGLLANEMRRLLADGRSADVTRAACDYLRELFGETDGPGRDLIVQAVADLEDPEFYVASIHALVRDLLDALQE